jgi:hypothetical protein
MNIEAIPVSCVGELIAKVVELTEHWNPVWFRGHANTQWHLEPKVQRNKKELGIKDDSYETNLTHRFRGRAQLYGPRIPYASNGAWLQTMQHHGLPTRLLDWSRSPLMAGYFAVEHAINTKDGTSFDDAAVWALNPHCLNSLATDGSWEFTPAIEAGTAQALVDGAFYGDSSARKSARAREWEWRSKVAHSAGDSIDDSNVVEADCLAVMASESDLRMFVQQGAFTVHSANVLPLEEDERYRMCLRKFEIQGKDLGAFAREVAACGLSEAAVYPDLDNLSRELARTQEGVGAR